MEMNWEIIYTVLSYAITLAMGIFGTYYSIGKGKLAQVKRVIDVLSEAVEDDDVTVEEEKAIVAAVRAVIGM